MMNKNDKAIKAGTLAVPDYLVSLKVCAEEQGANAVLSLLNEAADVLIAVVPPEIIPPILGVKAASYVGLQALAARKSRRLINILLAVLCGTEEKFNRLREYEVDQFEAIRSEIKTAMEQEYEQKARILIELLEERLSPERALAKDKHHRFNRWVLGLEYLELLALSVVDENWKGEDFHFGKIIAGKPIMADATFILDVFNFWNHPELNKIPKDYKADPEMTFARLVSVGMAYLDKNSLALQIKPAGGKKVERVVLHEDFFEFCDWLRRGLGRRSLDS